MYIVADAVWDATRRDSRMAGFRHVGPRKNSSGLSGSERPRGISGSRKVVNLEVRGPPPRSVEL